MRIFITGVSCVGKTTIGAKLAQRLGYQFFDLDEEIERFFGTTIQRLQDQFLTMHSFRNEGAKVLIDLLNRPESRDCVIAMSPSGLMGGYWRVIKKTTAVTIVLKDKPENILKRITFYDIDSQLIVKELTPEEMYLYLKEIREDIDYFRPSYKRATCQVDISGLDADETAEKVEQTLAVIIRQKTEGKIPNKR